MTEFFPRLKTGNRKFSVRESTGIFCRGSTENFLYRGFNGFNGFKVFFLLPRTKNFLYRVFFRDPGGPSIQGCKRKVFFSKRIQKNPKESKRIQKKVFFGEFSFGFLRVYISSAKSIQMVYKMYFAMFLMLVGVNSQSYIKMVPTLDINDCISLCEGVFQSNVMFVADPVDQLGCQTWVDNEIGTSNVFCSCNSNGALQIEQATLGMSYGCLCKLKCHGNLVLVGNSCVPCIGMIEAAYTDENGYVPEKCVTKDKLKTRYNELVCRL